MLDWHPYNSTCNCEPCKIRTLALQERPDRVEPSKLNQAQLVIATMAMRYAFTRVRAQLSAAGRLAYQQLLLTEPGTPAAVALTNHLQAEADSFLAGTHASAEVVELRAALRLEKARSLNLRETIEHALGLEHAGLGDDARAALLNAVDHGLGRPQLPGELDQVHRWDEAGDGCWDCFLSLYRARSPVFLVPDLTRNVAGTFPRERLEGLTLEVRFVDGERVGYLRPAVEQIDDGHDLPLAEVCDG